MRWTEQEPRLPLQPLSSLQGRLRDRQGPDLDPADEGLTVYAPYELRASVWQHLRDSEIEQGGLLLGEVFTYEGRTDAASSRAVLLTQSVAADEFLGSGVSLRMESGLWETARAARGPMEIVVGWYHSHPGLGAFFSHTDRRTQAAFFNQPYSVGWVIDPFNSEQAVFIGANAEPTGAFIALEEGAI